MQVHSMHFKARTGAKLADQRLQENLKKLTTKFVSGRANAILDLDDYEATRSAAATMRQRAIDHLDVWLELFEQQATNRGAQVLYAQNSAEAAQLIVQIARQHGIKKAIKTKSMVTEEMALNQALQDAGVVAVETDLGEYILQINGNEAPSHIVAPVVHKDKEEIAEIFARVHHTQPSTEIPALTREAREMLRPHFASAEMGITGGNFLIAETGSVALVTNEGNEGMCTLLPPKVHVAVTGIEKVLPSLSDLATLMRLLPRSASGQAISNYFTLLTGPKREGDADGPEQMYFVLVDSGRTELIGSDLQDMLRCIRCGACMNHCPVYQKIGGHTYGWVYPGPMGSVLTPTYVGIENALDLPQASTLCGQCDVVCPVKIPLPDLLRKLRQRQFAAHLRPSLERLGLAVWGFLATRPKLYRLAVRCVSGLLAMWGGSARKIRQLPGGWSDGRDMPTPSGKTFRDWYATQKKQENTKK